MEMSELRTGGLLRVNVRDQQGLLVRWDREELADSMSPLYVAFSQDVALSQVAPWPGRGGFRSSS